MSHSPPDNKEKLINVAIDLFAEHGFKGTSIRDIAGAMDMSISNIYHYFGNKQGLLLAILQHSTKGLLDNLRRASELSLEPLEHFTRLLKEHIRLAAEYKKEVKIFFLDEERLSPEGHEINRQLQKEIMEIYLKELGTLKKHGYVYSRNLTILAFNILGVINWHLRWYLPEGRLAQDEISEEIVSFILHGVLGPGASGVESSHLENA